MDCWGCGAAQPPAPAKAFQTCARCREDGIHPASPFCSKDCLRANWDRHKKWHAEQKQGDDGLAKDSAKEKSALAMLKTVLREQPKSETKNYMGLLMQADDYKLKGSYTKAEELLQSAVAINESNPVGHAALGEIKALLNQPAAAAKQYVHAVSLFPKDVDGSNPQALKLWATSTLSAIFWLNVPPTDGGMKAEEHPEWFNDVELKELTGKLCAAAPGDLRSWQTRAFVLCPMPDMPPQWNVPPCGMMRSEAELQEAGRCWQRVMEMTPGGKEVKRPYVARAAHCFRSAQMVAEQLKANGVNGMEANGVNGMEAAPEATPPPPAPPANPMAFASPQSEAVPAW